MTTNNETEPRNIGLTTCTCIKVREDDRPYVPVGWIDFFTACPDGWMPCEGQWLPIIDYPQLYELIGDQYCQRTITETLPMPAWKVVLMFFGFTFRPQVRHFANPDYRPGFFQLPDCRPAWIKAAVTLGYTKPEKIRGMASRVAAGRGELP